MRCSTQRTTSASPTTVLNWRPTATSKKRSIGPWFGRVIRSRFCFLLPVVLLCAACSRQAQQGIGFIDPALATLTPADTTVLVGARLDKLRESATYQRHFANAHFPALDHFSQQT